MSQVAIEYLWKMKADAVAKLGGKCVACGIEDLRVLQINHLNGRSNKRECGQRIYKPILDGTRATDDLDVRCANCNVIYEYERGNRRTPVWFGLDDDAPDDKDMIEDFLKEE